MIMHPRPSPEELLAEVEPFTAAARQAVACELRMHKLLGNSVAVWQDGRVVIVPPEEIVIDEPSPPNLDPPRLLTPP
jgi:hypothetical protein